MKRVKFEQDQLLFYGQGATYFCFERGLGSKVFFPQYRCEASVQLSRFRFAFFLCRMDYAISYIGILDREKDSEILLQLVVQGKPNYTQVKEYYAVELFYVAQKELLFFHYSYDLLAFDLKTATCIVANKNKENSHDNRILRVRYSRRKDCVLIDFASNLTSCKGGQLKHQAFYNRLEFKS